MRAFNNIRRPSAAPWAGTAGAFLAVLLTIGFWGWPAGVAEPNGYYYAFLTDEGAAGPVLAARFDAGSGKGWLYAPPRITALRVGAGADGLVRIETSRRGLKFSGGGQRGPISGEGIIGAAAAAEGSFGVGTRSAGDANTGTWHPFFTTDCPMPPGLYSDRKFSSEAQEWTGSELILFGCGPGYSGVLTLYEGVPIGPAIVRARAAKAGHAVVFTAPRIISMLAAGPVHGPQGFVIRAEGSGVTMELPASLGGNAGPGEFLGYRGEPVPGHGAENGGGALHRRDEKRRKFR